MGATALGLALGLTVADGALAASEIGRNLGQEINSWGKWLVLGVACLVGLPAMARRDVPGALVIGGLVVLIGGFVFAPSAVEDVITSLWKSIGTGR